MNEALGNNRTGREGSWTRQPAVPTKNGWRGATWATHAASKSCKPLRMTGRSRRVQPPSGSQTDTLSVRGGSSVFILTPKGIHGGWQRVQAKAEESRASYTRDKMCSCKYYH